MLYIDRKYAAILGSRLKKFKQLSSDRWNFRCPICGDSKKNEFKARGYIYNVEGALNFKCWNCSFSCSLGTLIKRLDENLYKEYTFEKFKNGSDSKFVYHNKPIFLKEKKEVNSSSVLKDVSCIVDLPYDHIALHYLRSRKIPIEFYPKIYYTDTFYSWINSIKPGKFPEIYKDEPRLIFPFFDKEGNVFSTNSRSFDKKAKKKYIIIKLDEDAENVYGLDTIDFSKRFYVLEGQIDQMFLPNCVAVSGTNLDANIIKQHKENAVFVMDNEPRNVQATKILYNHILNGYNVCLWPETFKFKDINDAILGGMTTEEIVDIINKNTVSGTEAKVKFTFWKKCEI